MKSNHQQRLRDFEQRAAYSPDSVLQHRSSGWRYLPIHAFSDKEASEDTVTADCWCLLGGDAALLECIAKSASELAPGFYFRRDTSEPHWPKLFAVLSVPAITRAAAEGAMQHFADLGFPDGALFGGSFSNKLVRLPDESPA